MDIEVVTLFPEMVEPAAGFGVTGRAIERGIWRLRSWNPRDHATDELSVRVQPTLLPEVNVLANVSGVFNAVSVTGDVVGTTLYIGRGAEYNF